MGREHQQRIEPSSSLINTFRDEIPREGILEQLFVLEWIVSLSVGHTARLEPTVEDLFDALEVPFAFFRGDGDVVDFITMEIRDAFDA